MQNRSINRRAVLVVLLAAAATAASALAQDTKFSTLYRFEAPAANYLHERSGVSTGHHAGFGSGRRHLRDD